MKLQLPLWFADGLVLPGGREAFIHGRASPGARVALSGLGLDASVNAESDGCFSLPLGMLKAGMQGELRVVCGHDERVVREVCVGECWLASGQSNMQYQVKAASDAAALHTDATCGDLRLLSNEGWKRLLPESVDTVSAVALAFAAERARRARCPIGFAVAARGGTRIEAWMSRRALEGTAAGRQALQLAADPEVQAAAAFDREKFRPLGETRLSRWGLGRALPCELYETLLAPLVGIPLSGVLWYQGESNAVDVQQARQYEALLASFIGALRGDWRDAMLPCVVIGLPRYEPDEATRLAWDALRTSQRAVAERLPGIRVVDVFEHGDPKDIHPTTKRPVGVKAGAEAQKEPDMQPRGTAA